MATRSGVQLALGKLFGISVSRLQSVARELNYADLRKSTGRGQRPVHLTGAEIFAHALPIVMRLPIREFGQSLADILRMPVEQPSYAFHGGAGQDPYLPDLKTASIGRTFGDVVGQLIDGDLQSAFGFTDDSEIAIQVDTLGLKASVRIHGKDAVLTIWFSWPAAETRQDAPLSWQTIHMTERLINRLAVISKKS